MASQLTYQFWRHRVNGATFAVRLEDDIVTGFYGPVAGDDLHPDDLPLYPFDQSPGDLAWALAHSDQFLKPGGHSPL